MSESSKEHNAPGGAKPRTWRLERWNNGLYEDYDLADGPSQLQAQERVWSIELEPVLDLLERLSMDVGMQESYQKCWNDGTLERTRALLREHGRKTEEWELDEE